MRISDWSSDVCSSDLTEAEGHHRVVPLFDPKKRARFSRALQMRQNNLESFDRVLLQIVVGLYRGDGWPEGYSVLPPAFTKFSDLSQMRDIHPMAVSADRKSTRMNSSH